MSNKYLPITLREICLYVLEPSMGSSRQSLKKLDFDIRRDFILFDNNLRIAVNLTFTNNQYYDNPACKGVRRPLTLSLIDTTCHHTLANVGAYAFVPPCKPLWSNIALIRLADTSALDPSHEFMVQVVDDKTQTVIGERNLRLFPIYHNGNDITEAFDVVNGGVVPEGKESPYLAFDVEAYSVQEIFFNLVADDWTKGLSFIPEMEVRIYYPDGSVFGQFANPQPDGLVPGSYRVITTFPITAATKGIIYAELIYLDFTIACIAVNSDSASCTRGLCSGRDLYVLSEYSLEGATEKFNRMITAHENDEFELLLDNFVNSLSIEPDDDEAVYSDEDDAVSTDDNADAVSTDDAESASSADEDETENAADIDQYASPLDALDNLTGLKDVKDKLLSYENLMRFNKMRADRNLPVVNLPLHAMFLGSPGTGKTTVAKRMGLMLKKTGVLSSGHVVIRERATLLGPNYSSEETNTQAAIEEAQGGILFIDEAYQLYQPNDPRDPGRFVIEALMTALADESRRDWMLILAGYTDEMKRMFDMNPGLKSRIPESNIYIFDDFSESELMEIAERYLDRHNYLMTDEAKDALKHRLCDDYSHRDRNFGNARHVINLIQTEILPSMAQRVVSMGKIDNNTLTEIQPSDIPTPHNFCQSQRRKIGYSC